MDLVEGCSPRSLDPSFRAAKCCRPRRCSIALRKSSFFQVYGGKFSTHFSERGRGSLREIYDDTARAAVPRANAHRARVNSNGITSGDRGAEGTARHLEPKRSRVRCHAELAAPGRDDHSRARGAVSSRNRAVHDVAIRPIRERGRERRRPHRVGVVDSDEAKSP